MRTFLLPVFIKIESYQFININRISDNLGKEISDFYHRYMLSLVVTQHRKNLNLGRFVFKKVCRDFVIPTSVKMLGLNIILIKRIVQKAKVFVKTIMPDK